MSSWVSSMQAVSAPVAAPTPPAQPDPRLQKGPLYIMAPGSGLLTGGTQLVHQQQVQRRLYAILSVISASYPPCWLGAHTFRCRVCALYMACLY